MEVHAPSFRQHCYALRNSRLSATMPMVMVITIVPMKLLAIKKKRQTMKRNQLKKRWKRMALMTKAAKPPKDPMIMA